ncbi:MAG TPA: 1-deoxy-D-xylulose-5-phosphate reductoisomerase [Actinomycetota bacterium]|nr:1-deoxy-D-xylulose-5-phosphate reductoisomerase [Actinomycetota bacterium]
MGRIGARSVTILGSTGSIGTQALDVIDRAPESFRVHALAAHTDADAIVRQAEKFRPRRVAVVDSDAAAAARERLFGVDVLDGPDALTELAKDPDTDVVLNAVVGAAGLQATLASLDAGRRVALANKESCVAGGPLVARRLRAGAELVPVDSEHASTHMCLAGELSESVARLVLTASGGPFRGRTTAELEGVTPEDALRHPTWNMGAKITIDSATLMNKGLEVLEANVLFGLGFGCIDVVCHPQSVVHCLVRFTDGSWKAALGPPDMRVPIAYALGHPARADWKPDDVDWTTMAALTFEPVDTDVFRCLPLAYEAGRTGGTAPAVLNAANEIAVASFLSGGLRFPRIAEVVARVVDDGSGGELGYGEASIELADVLRADAWARERAKSIVAG